MLLKKLFFGFGLWLFKPQGHNNRVKWLGERAVIAGCTSRRRSPLMLPVREGTERIPMSH